MSNLTDNIKKAFMYKNASEYKKAIDYFYKALAEENDSVQIMTELADLYYELSQFDRSINLYEQILQKNSSDLNILYKYSNLLIHLKQFDKAEEILNQLLNSNYYIENVLKLLFDIYVKTKKYNEIINVFNKKINSVNDSEIFYFVGCAYEYNGNFQLAEEYYLKSYNLDSYVLSGINLANLYFISENYTKAEELAFSLLKYSENDKLLYLIAELYFNKNDYDDAIKYYYLAINQNNKNSLYFYKLGIVYTIKGFYKEAEEAYCQAIVNDSYNELYNYTLAYFYYSHKKYVQAENIVNIFLSQFDSNLLFIALKILLLLNKNQVADATSYIEKIKDITITEDIVFYALALYYSKLDLFKKSIFYIKKAIELNPLSLNYKIDFVSFLFEIKSFDEAKKICLEIISANSKYILAYLFLSKINLIQDDFVLALDNAENVIKLDKNIYEAYFIKAEVLFNKKDYVSAIDNYRVVLSINPDYNLCYEKIGNCYFELKKYDEAYFYYKEAVGLDIANVDNYYKMAKCSMSLNNKENALSSFSLMNRLQVKKISYIEDYALFLNQCGEKKKALTLLKKAVSRFENISDKEKLKNIIKSLKK